MIPQKTVEEILSVARVEEVVEDFVNLKRRGVNMMGNCPFHDEKTPSFVVSPTKGIYKCFGCGKSGTAVGFVMEHEQLSFPEALKYLAAKYNITVEEKEVSQEERAAMQLTDSYYIINEFAATFFKSSLHETDEGKAIGLAYYKERGFLKKTMDQWGLGYSLNEGKALFHAARDKQFNVEHMKTLGLLTQYDSDFFKGRVMFPIHNLGGKIIAFAGRVLGKDKNQPKYINSPESEIYNKRKILYGMYFAKTSVRKHDECLMVEGYTDVITLHQGGVENVVASSGTSLTVEQIRLVKRFTDNIKIIYDGDPAGIKAALRGLDLVLAENLNVRLVLLPKDEDPDSFFKKSGYDAFTRYLDEHSRDFIDFKTELLLEEAGNDPIKRSKVLKDIIESIALIPDAIKRSVYIQQTSSRLQIEESVLAGELELNLRKLQKDKQQQQQRDRIRSERNPFINEVHHDEESGEITMLPTPESSKVIGQDDFIERELVRLLVTGCEIQIEKNSPVSVHEYLLPFVSENAEYFTNPAYDKIFRFALNRFDNKQLIRFTDFAHHEDEDIRNLAVDVSLTKFTFAKWNDKGVYLQTQQMPEDNFKRDCYQAMLRFRLRVLKKEIDTLEKLIHDNPADDRSIDIKVIQQLMIERNEIARELTQIVY